MIINNSILELFHSCVLENFKCHRIEEKKVTALKLEIACGTSRIKLTYRRRRLMKESLPLPLPPRTDFRNIIRKSKITVHPSVTKLFSYDVADNRIPEAASSFLAIHFLKSRRAATTTTTTFLLSLLYNPSQPTSPSFQNVQYISKCIYSLPLEFYFVLNSSFRDLFQIGLCDRAMRACGWIEMHFEFFYPYFSRIFEKITYVLFSILVCWIGFEIDFTEQINKEFIYFCQKDGEKMIV